MVLSLGPAILIGALVLLYGFLVGGTWTRRNPAKLFDTVSTILLLAISAFVSIHLVIVGARQSEAFRKAQDRLDCVAVQLAAVRAQAPMPDCQIAWDQ